MHGQNHIKFETRQLYDESIGKEWKKMG